MSAFTPAKRAGFALAAVLAGDRTLTQVEGRLDADEMQRTRGLSAREPVDKAGLIASLLASVRPRLESLPEHLPLRLRVLLAPQLPREQARALLSNAAVAAAGFVLADELLPRLLRIARRSIELRKESR